jgi:hypothetical protein
LRTAGQDLIGRLLAIFQNCHACSR